MPQQIKVTRSFQSPRPSIVAANYTVPMIDAGKLIMLSSDAIIACFLPEISQANAGAIFQFMVVNTGPLHLVAPSNTIFSSVSVNAGHSVKSVRTGANVGVLITALCDPSAGGTGNWRVWGTVTASNVRSFTEA